MKVSSKGCYALQIMVDLAIYQGKGYIPLKDICLRRGIEVVKYVEQVVNLLQKAGLINSLRGSNGGYKLSKDVTEYTVGQILRVTEGELAPNCCQQGSLNNCNEGKK